MNNSKHMIPAFLILTCIFLLHFTIMGCSNHEQQEAKKESTSNQKKAVKIVYVDWASEIASANIVKVVVEDKLNLNCELLPVSLIAMWESIGVGDQDGMVAGWLPTLQARYLEQFKDQVDNLGPNLEGTKIGLVVPQYVNISSIDDLNESSKRFGHKIIGIDPHAGLMEKTTDAIETYNLDGFELVSGSGPTMTKALENAIEENRWIVVTGWTPHWKFARWDLKYLEDPKNVFGNEEYISTIVRKDLKKDLPEVYSFLDNFKWSPADMAQVMLWAQEEETSYLEAARRWVKKNEEHVETWLKK